MVLPLRGNVRLIFVILLACFNIHQVFAWKPDDTFLIKHCGIANLQALKKPTSKRPTAIDLKVKPRDFEHLLFNKANSVKILQFGDFMNGLIE